MADPVLIRPDHKFVHEIAAAGGGDLKKCFQCATCSAVCALSTGCVPFPRKEMHWAQWGLKDRLFGDPDVWLCHQCGDCSVQGPRGARPADVLAAVRALVVRHFSVPRPLATWLTRPSFLAVAFAATAALLVAALLVRGPIEASLGIAAHETELYAGFFPHWLLIAFFSLFTALGLAAAAVGLTRFWRALVEHDGVDGSRPALTATLPALRRALTTILTHRQFGQCTSHRYRWLAHLGVFLGFAVLFLVTVWAVIDLYLFPVLGIASSYPFDLNHPMKLLANLGGAALVVGAVQVMVVRGRHREHAPASSTFDWYFLSLVLGVGSTGFAVEILRFAAGPDPAYGIRATAYATYFIHLVLVFQLLVFLPYTKFAHMLYRTVAMVYAERTGRNHQTSRRLA